MNENSRLKKQFLIRLRWKAQHFSLPMQFAMSRNNDNKQQYHHRHHQFHHHDRKQTNEIRTCRLVGPFIFLFAASQQMTWFIALFATITIITTTTTASVIILWNKYFVSFVPIHYSGAEQRSNTFNLCAATSQPHAPHVHVYMSKSPRPNNCANALFLQSSAAHSPAAGVCEQIR